MPPRRVHRTVPRRVPNSTAPDTFDLSVGNKAHGITGRKLKGTYLDSTLSTEIFSVPRRVTTSTAPETFDAVTPNNSQRTTGRKAKKTDFEDTLNTEASSSMFSGSAAVARTQRGDKKPPGLKMPRPVRPEFLRDTKENQHRSPPFSAARLAKTASSTKEIRTPRSTFEFLRKATTGATDESILANTTRATRATRATDSSTEEILSGTSSNRSPSASSSSLSSSHSHTNWLTAAATLRRCLKLLWKEPNPSFLSFHFRSGQEILGPDSGDFKRCPHNSRIFTG